MLHIGINKVVVGIHIYNIFQHIYVILEKKPLFCFLLIISRRLFLVQSKIM